MSDSFYLRPEDNDCPTQGIFSTLFNVKCRKSEILKKLQASTRDCEAKVKLNTLNGALYT